MDSGYLQRKDEFTEWFKEQPVIGRPYNKYAQPTMKAAIDLLEKGLAVLNIPQYKGTNCFTISKSSDFNKLYNICYEAAKAWDTVQGHRDFRNALDFYMHYLDIKNKTQFHTKDFFLANIRYLIREYKRRFNKINEMEFFKWNAVNEYKKYWDIEASDFPTMLAKAFGSTESLLSGSFFYPYKLIVEYAEEKPNIVKELFRELYDENKTLEERFLNFRNGFNKYLEDKLKREKGRTKALNHFQSLRSVMVYLTCQYPEKYYFYKDGMFIDFRKLYGYQDIKIKRKKKTNKYEKYRSMCELIVQEVKKDKELVSLNQKRVANLGFKDEALHILTMDLIYFGAVHLPRELQGVVTSKNEKEKVIMNYEQPIVMNKILYGPPGTGKTYSTIIEAIAIIENKDIDIIAAENYNAVQERYKKYKSNGQIAFTTFHQSYGYEEFIEGIKPQASDDDDDSTDISYSVQSGIFKKFCENAQVNKKIQKNLGINDDPTIWKVSLGGTHDNPIRTYCLEHDQIRIGYDFDGEELVDYSTIGPGKSVLKAFIEGMNIGDIVLSCYTNKTIDAIGIVVGEPEKDDALPYKRFRKVSWLIKNIEENIFEINGNTDMTLKSVYKLNRITMKDIYSILEKNKYEPQNANDCVKKDNYVFIIDEINRGNISKIFGELITLVEDSKRLGEAEGMTVKLPYSGKEFGIPNNVYIIGTMNTADRSIALMDTALRRRFSFVEMMPKPALLNEVKVNNISIGQLLRDMNEKITVLYDREHTIGHAYFMPLVKELKEKERFKLLGEIFKNKIIPLLQEYFYDDYAKIRLVLGDDKAGNTPQFIKKNSSKAEILFGKTNVEKFGLEGTIVYSINDDAFKSKEAYNHILNTPVKISKEDKETPNPNDGAPNATIEDNEKQDKLASPKPSEGTKS